MRLYIALIVSKTYLFIQKCFKKERSDKAGLIAARICPDILRLVAKPKKVIMVTGTNGKTTTCFLMCDGPLNLHWYGIFFFQHLILSLL